MNSRRRLLACLAFAMLAACAVVPVDREGWVYERVSLPDRPSTCHSLRPDRSFGPTGQSLHDLLWAKIPPEDGARQALWQCIDESYAKGRISFSSPEPERMKDFVADCMRGRGIKVLRSDIGVQLDSSCGS